MRFDDAISAVDKMDAEYSKGDRFTLDAIGYGFDEFLEEVKPSVEDVMQTLEVIFEVKDLNNSNKRLK